jgi:hypothetical protein
MIHGMSETVGRPRCDQCGNPEHVKESPAA